MTNFNIQSEFMKNKWIPSRPVSNDDKLSLYAYYKQSTIGNCNLPQPNFYQFEERAKWDAWNNLLYMNENVAKKCYCTLAEELIKKYQ